MNAAIRSIVGTFARKSSSAFIGEPKASFRETRALLRTNLDADAISLAGKPAFLTMVPPGGMLPGDEEGRASSWRRPRAEGTSIRASQADRGTNSRNSTDGR